MSNKEHVDFFTNQNADVKTAPIKVSVLDVALFCYGVFDGANVSIQVSPDALAEDPDTMAWFDHPEGMFTDATQAPVNFWNNADFAEVYIRAVLSDAGAQTNLNFKMRPRVEKAIG